MVTDVDLLSIRKPPPVKAGPFQTQYFSNAVNTASSVQSVSQSCVSHMFCISVFSSYECYRCKSFVLQCSPLERASRSLAKTGSCFRVFEVLFSCLFSARFLEGVGRVFWRPYGSFWINFEVIWESFL